jgi:hypothetical protein
MAGGIYSDFLLSGREISVGSCPRYVWELVWKRQPYFSERVYSESQSLLSPGHVQGMFKSMALWAYGSLQTSPTAQ